MISYLKHEQELLNSHSRREIFIINRCILTGESHAAMKYESYLKMHVFITCVLGPRGSALGPVCILGSCCHQLPKWFCCPCPLWRAHCYISSCVNTVLPLQMSTLSSSLLYSNKIPIFHKQESIHFSRLIFQVPNHGLSNFK